MKNNGGMKDRSLEGKCEFLHASKTHHSFGGISLYYTGKFKILLGMAVVIHLQLTFMN